MFSIIAVMFYSSRPGNRGENRHLTLVTDAAVLEDRFRQTQPGYDISRFDVVAKEHITRGVRGALHLVVERPEWEPGALCPHNDGEGAVLVGRAGAAAPFLCARCVEGPEFLNQALQHDARFGVWPGSGPETV